MTSDVPARRDADGLPEVRISDAERDTAVTSLRDHCTDGRLTLDEFSDRVGLVYAAKTAADLERVTADLPVPAPAPALTPQPDRTMRARRAVKWTVSIFTGSRQRGRWRIEDETTAVAFMGGCHLDLREAEVIGHQATITAVAFMGGVDIVVPEGIEVAFEVFAFMGGRHAKVRDVPVIPGSPLIRVRGVAFMGGVTVRSKGASLGRGRERGRLDRGPDRDRSRHRDRSRARDRRRIAEPARPPAIATRGIDAVTADVRNEWPALRAQVAPEGTVTIMFSDLEGFTSMCERLGDHRANELLREHYRLVRDELARHGGFEVKVHGDGFMVAFSSASRALRCALAIQRAQDAWNAGRPGDEVRVRMGLHTGEAIRDADDFLGTTVNTASRIASSAMGGEILVSGLLRELCVSSGEFAFDDGADVELRGLSQPPRIHRVLQP